ncbi:MAG: hypothetical protein ABI669_12500 [Usitatibacter sp.]
MKARILAAAVVSALSLGFGATALAAADHGAAHALESHRLTLDHGRKWGTDEALRRGMGEIRAALESRRAGISASSLRAPEYQALAGTVESQVAYIVANCKLPPAADENLHVVVAELVAAAGAMKGTSTADAARGARRAIGAANAYGKHFDHPGWRSL